MNFGGDVDGNAVAGGNSDKIVEIISDTQAKQFNSKSSQREIFQRFQMMTVPFGQIFRVDNKKRIERILHNQVGNDIIHRNS